MVAVQRALESIFGNVGGDLLCDITSRLKTAATTATQYTVCPLTQREGRERGDNVPSQCDTQTEAQTRCDECHNGRTSSEQQLNGSNYNVLPRLRALWLGSQSVRTDSVALLGCSSAARSAKKGRRYSLGHKPRPHNHSRSRSSDGV